MDQLSHIFFKKKKQSQSVFLVNLFFWWEWDLNTGLWACKAGAIPLEPYLQSILPCLFWRWGLANYFPHWPQTSILLISPSRVARIMDMNHWHLADLIVFKSTFSPSSSYLPIPQQGVKINPLYCFFYI
jgi:hypothetical protein